MGLSPGQVPGFFANSPNFPHAARDAASLLGVWCLVWAPDSKQAGFRYLFERLIGWRQTAFVRDTVGLAISPQPDDDHDPDPVPTIRQHGHAHDP